MDVQNTAREIVERALRATAKNHEPEAFVAWETAPLERFLNAQEIDEFLDRISRGITESGGDSKAFQFILSRASVPILQRSSDAVVGFVVQQFWITYLLNRTLAGDESAPEKLARAVYPGQLGLAPPPGWEDFMKADFRQSMAALRGGKPRLRLDDEEQKTLNDRYKRMRATLEAARKNWSIRTEPDEFLNFITVTPSAPSAVSTQVQVFFATDRMQITDLTAGVKYESQRSLNREIHYGRCVVLIPKIHEIGKLETPSILKLEFRPDPKKHIILSKTYSLSEDIFFQQLRSSVAKSAAKDAFVFIHGYNVSFEDAARRTGQIAYDLDFVGAPIFYSWPSNGKTADYLKDETNITWSTPHLEHFLGLLAEKSGAERIHIIAHSMGNRAVCDALKALSYNPTSQLKFNHLVLAAPDIDADTFQELAATLQRLSGRVTIYASSQDKAIQASKKIHGNPRAGEPLLIVRGMDTIDASAIDTDFLGHSYFSDNWPLLSDIHSILFKDEPPSGRFGLMAMEHEDGRYYAFKR